MNNLSRMTALLLIATAHAAAGEPLTALEVNLWTGTHRVLKNVDPQWLALASILAQPGRVESSIWRSRSSGPSAAEPMTPQTVVRGLRSPDGLSLHPVSGVLYVSHENDDLVRAIVNGVPVTVIDVNTPIYVNAGAVQARGPPLQMPEGIAFSQAGDLYVVEDRPGGRLIRFTLDSNGKSVGGEDVWVPGDWHHIAWEGVAVGPRGELLLSGSSAEDAMSGEVPGVFEGVLLYCDAAQNWWLLDRRPLRSFSQAAFSRDGRKIVYTCEVSGEVNWMDLSGKKLRWGSSANYAAKSPEGVCVLPDGRILVAEERGKIFLVDPETDKVRLFANAPGTLETLVWDGPSRQLLATEDLNGTILKWELNPPEPPGRYAIDHARFEPARTPRYIPERCPDFLAKVLAFGGADFGNPEAPLPFRVFAGRVPLVAVDAVTVPAWPADAAADPIVRLQAAVFNPAALTVPGFPQSGPSAIVIATTRSGKVLRTQSKEVSAAVAAFAMPFVQTVGTMRITVPFPAAVGVSEKGICNVHLMGLGEMADLHIVLNPIDPESSYVVVDDGRNGIRQYQLAGPRGEDLARNMVISFSRELSTQARWLGRDERFAQAEAGIQMANAH